MKMVIAKFKIFTYDKGVKYLQVDEHKFRRDKTILIEKEFPIC